MHEDQFSGHIFSGKFPRPRLGYVRETVICSYERTVLLRILFREELNISR